MDVQGHRQLPGLAIDSLVYGIILNHRKQQEVNDVHQEQFCVFHH